MSEHSRSQAVDVLSTTRAMISQLARGEPVRQRLPHGGRIHLDRALPFLAVYRVPSEGDDAATRGLVVSEPAYLIATGEPSLQPQITSLVLALLREMREQFGAALVVELWSARHPASPGVTRLPSKASTTVRRPTFRIAPGTLSASESSVKELERALTDIPLRPPPLDVEVVESAAPHPPDLPPLLPLADGVSERLHLIGIEVQPIYRQAKTGIAYPVLLRTARRGLAQALRQTFYHFAINHTSLRPEHYHALGRRTPLEAVWEADRRLSQITGTFDFLLQVTPVNSTRAWAEFRRRDFSITPEFDYRPLVVDAAALKRKLYSIRTDRLEDPTLAHLLDDTRDELDRRITMLTDRNTPRFLLGSMQVYGSVAEPLHQLAVQILSAVDSGDTQTGGGEELDAEAFAATARQELAYYQSRDRSLEATVEVSAEVPGVLVSQGHLLIGESVTIAASRADALLQHEIGTHVLTHHNGAAQPLSQLASGLAGYEELQEGIGVFAEYLAGGLLPSRLRTLAARVVAVRCLTDGAEFPEAFRELSVGFGIRERAAFTLCMRVYRSGGLTKDMVYLRGLSRLLAYLQAGGEFELLFLGKIALEHVKAVEELRWRQVLRPPRLLPRCLTTEPGLARAERARGGLGILDLLEPED